MIDVEPLIIEQLDELVPAPGAASADWHDVERRSATDERRTRPRRRLVLATGILLGVVFVAVAVAQSIGGFSGWLTGEPGKPAPAAQQEAFSRSIRSWTGFPAGTKLRQLVQTKAGGATYTLYGFRGDGSLCLRLVVTGNESAHELACPPLSLLRSSSEPALVVVADYGVGIGKKPASTPALPIFELRPPQALVTLGIVADGVDQVDITHDTGKTAHAVLGGDAFLSVDEAPSSGSHLTAVRAIAGGQGVSVPFALPPTPFSWSASTTTPLVAHGPAKVQRVVRGGAIRWLARREPIGVPVPKNVQHTVGVLSSVIFAREIAPDPSAPERIVVSVGPAGKAYSGLHLLNKLRVCAAVVGGRYGGGGNCWPAGRLFSSAPFNWSVTDGGSNQFTTITGLAADTVAQLRLYLGSGQQEAVALHDNGYLVEAPSTAYPLRLVGYDSQGRVIGIVTFRGNTGLPAGAPARAQPVANAHWRMVLKDGAGEILVAPSTTGGTCYAIHWSHGGQINCPPALPADSVNVEIDGGDKRAAAAYIRAGTAIKAVVVRYRNGHAQTIELANGLALAAIPAGDATETGSFANDLASYTGLDANGRALVTQNVLALTGGAGAISELTATSVSIGHYGCKITSDSPPLAGYRLGVHVRYLCDGGALTLIGRTLPGGTWAARTVYTTGPIVAVSATKITIASTTCSLGAASPSVSGYTVGEQVLTFCAAGKLTGINKASS
jgi:hypothetical protein